MTTTKATKRKGMTPSRLASIIAGLVSALGLAYAGLAVIWNLPYADQVQQTCGVIVSLISAVLAVFTGQKLAKQ